MPNVCPREVFCGGAFNLAMSEIKGMVQMWGIYQPNKEANMYPKPVHDLSGWNVRAIACNSKVRFCVLLCNSKVNVFVQLKGV